MAWYLHEGCLLGHFRPQAIREIAPREPSFRSTKIFRAAELVATKAIFDFGCRHQMWYGSADDQESRRPTRSKNATFSNEAKEYVHTTC